MGPSDEHLMAAFQRGEAAAFRAIVERYERRLWNFVRAIVRDRAMAEDLVQETFLRLVRERNRWRTDGHLSGWLFRVARNLCVDHLRRSIRRASDSLDTRSTGATDNPGVHEAAHSPAGASQNRQQLEEALATLPPEQREVFLLRELGGFRFAEIAEIVGASEPTVKSRLRYAYEKLRNALTEPRTSDPPLVTP